MVVQGTNSYVKGMGSALLLPNPSLSFLPLHDYTGSSEFTYSLTIYLTLHMPRLCTEDRDCQNPMSQPTCSPHHNHQSNSKVQWTTVNLSGTVSAKSTLCFIATGMGYLKPTAIPVQEWPQIQVQQKLGKKKITTGIQTESQLCTGWHIPSAKHSLDCNQQRTMASSILQSNTNHSPLGHLLMVQRREKHSKMHHPLWTTWKYAVMQQDDAVSLPRHLFLILKYSSPSLTQLVCNSYVNR